MTDILKDATPRPWFYGRLTNTNIEGPHERTICSTGGYSSNSCDKWVTENPANATLIVTAVNSYEPMLEALEAIRDLIQDDGGNPRHSAALGREFDNAVYQIDSALAKAKGGQS